MEPRWKIGELAEVVQQTLVSAGQAEQLSARVRDVPDLRTIRYYTTLGLVDRPTEMRGRTAYYGWRHLWQLLAIKQLQAGGLTLVEIQQRLAGADDRTLKKLARVTGRPPFGAAPTEQPSTPSCRPTAGKRTTFWADAPAMAQAVDTAAPLGADGAVVRPALHVKLDEGVTLVLEGVELGALNRDKLAAVEHAARGLIRQLRRLLRQPSSVAPPVQQSSPMVTQGGGPPDVVPDPGGAERIPS